LSESREVLTKFITYQLGKELRSLKVLKRVLSEIKKPENNISLSPGGRGVE